MNTPAHICPHCGQPTGPVFVSVTPKMFAAVVAIAEGIKANGYAPSYDEIARSMGCKSKGQVATWVMHLVERGWLIRRKHLGRSIQLTHRAWAEIARLDTKRAA